MKLGIEADVILLHPYDYGHWGFDRMDSASDDRYLEYVVARLAAYRNVWWSMANEWSLMKKKTAADWDRFFQIVQANDPYDHLITTSYAHARQWPVDVWDAGMEIIQEHNYGGTDMAQIVYAAAKEMMTQHLGKPFLIGEMGIGSGNEEIYDPTGIYLHTTNWGSLMAKAAGGGFSWWWDNYIHPNNLYFRYRGVSGFVEGEDLDQRSYSPVIPEVSTSYLQLSSKCWNTLSCACYIYLQVNITYRNRQLAQSGDKLEFSWAPSSSLFSWQPSRSCLPRELWRSA